MNKDMEKDSYDECFNLQLRLRLSPSAYDIDLSEYQPYSPGSAERAAFWLGATEGRVAERQCIFDHLFALVHPTPELMAFAAAHGYQDTRCAMAKFKPGFGIDLHLKDGCWVAAENKE